MKWILRVTIIRKVTCDCGFKREGPVFLFGPRIGRSQLPVGCPFTSGEFIELGLDQRPRSGSYLRVCISLRRFLRCRRFMSQSDPNDAPRFLIGSSQGPRSEQQDSGICLFDEAKGTALLVVGDGVGGRSGGRIASQKVAELASNLWQERKGQLAKPAEELATLCQVAHEHINGEGAKLGISPRTTIVALYLSPSHAYWVHSGDSRLYHFKAGRFIERTEDHSLLELMVQQGAVKEEDMGRHPDQNTLLQSLGGDEFSPPSTGMSEVSADDGFLVCTDGFWERTTPEEMVELVFSDRASAGDLLNKAVERAVERNGPKGDNVTVAVAMPSRSKVAVAPVLATPGRSRRNLALLAAAAAIVILAVLLLLAPNRKKPGTAEASSAAKPVEVDPMPPAAAANATANTAGKPTTPEPNLPNATPSEKQVAVPPAGGPAPIPDRPSPAAASPRPQP